MFRFFVSGRFSALVAGLLLLSIAIGVVDPWLTKDASNVAVNLVEEIELDSEEMRHDWSLEPIFHSASQVTVSVATWALLLSDRPRLGVGDSFLEPLAQRPPPRIDLCS